MFKKLLVVAAFALVPAAHACVTSYRAASDLTAVIKANGGFNIPDEKCKLLAEAGMEFNIAANATVLSGVSVGWVTVNVIDKNNVVSDVFIVNTTVNAKQAGSMNLANQLMYSSLNNAVRDLDVAKGIGEIRAFRARSK